MSDTMSLSNCEWKEFKFAEARLGLAETTKIVLQNGLGILGVTAPERM